MNRQEHKRLEWHPIAVRALLINAFILFCVFSSRFDQRIALAGGIGILLYLFVLAFAKPKYAFFLIFGIKLTFDALWYIKLPDIESIGLLELFFIPVLAIILLSLKDHKSEHAGLLWLVAVYLVWVFLSTMLNGYFPDVALIVRQSGLLIGLLLGFSYLASERHFLFSVYLIFISTIMPVLASTLQFMLSRVGIVVLNYKLDTIRGVRPSGLYYDAATAGMVSLISVLACMFLFHNRQISRKFDILFIVMITLNCVIILTGGTRSMIITFFLCLIIFAIMNKRAVVSIGPLIAIITILLFPYIKKTVERTVSWELIKIMPNQSVDIRDALQETEYRTLFAGRVGMWQDIWNRYKRGSALQQMFGSGLSSNSHSSYLFLLLQIGWTGVAFYILLNILLIWKLFTTHLTKIYKIIGILCILLVLLVGISATTVLYTSFQWITYLMVGSFLNIGSGERAAWTLRHKKLAGRKAVVGPGSVQA